jgi:hypothetical protein
VSRVWVEQYVSQPDRDDDLGVEGGIAPNTNVWLSGVVDQLGVPNSFGQCRREQCTR